MKKIQSEEFLTGMYILYEIFYWKGEKQEENPFTNLIDHNP